MISFTIPQKLNGAQLMAEFFNAGIDIDVPFISDDKLWLSIKSSDKSKAEEIVKNHVGIESQPTIIDKLNSAGIDLNDLRVALGL